MIAFDPSAMAASDMFMRDLCDAVVELTEKGLIPSKTAEALLNRALAEVRRGCRQ